MENGRDSRIRLDDREVEKTPMGDYWVGEWHWEFFLQHSLWSGYILHTSGTCWPYDDRLRDGRDSGMQSDDEDVDADERI